MMDGLTAGKAQPLTIMIETTYSQSMSSSFEGAVKKEESLLHTLDHLALSRDLSLTHSSCGFHIRDYGVIQIDQVVRAVGKERSFRRGGEAGGGSVVTNFFGMTEVEPPKAGSSKVSRYSRTARPAALGGSRSSRRRLAADRHQPGSGSPPHQSSRGLLGSP